MTADNVSSFATATLPPRRLQSTPVGQLAKARKRPLSARRDNAAGLHMLARSTTRLHPFWAA